MKKVLVVATSRKTRGGITSVVKTYEACSYWDNCHCHWIQTHRDGPAWRKMLYALCGYLTFVLRIPFYDIAHFHVSLQNSVRRKLPLVKLAKLLNKKIIIHVHCSTQVDEIWNENYERMFGCSDMVLVLSNEVKTLLTDKYKVKAPIIVLYNPCPIIATSVTTAHKYILFAGMLVRDKGYADLIAAFAKVAGRYRDWKLVLAGCGETDNARMLADRYGVTSQIDFCGWISGDKKERMYSNAGIFCLPSYAEGFPMSILEAWAYGVPVITTPVGGICDVAVDGENILLFTPGDVETLAVQLERLISDKELYEKLSQASLNLAQTTFSQDSISKQLGDIYCQL